MQVNATSIGSFPVNAAIAPYLRVKMSGGYLALAGAEDIEIGTTKQRILVSGVGAVSYGGVVLRNAFGTVKMIAAGAITAYTSVYGASSGRVNDVPNGNPIGIALTATTAAGDELEVLRMPSPSGGKSFDFDDIAPGIVIDEDFLGDWPAAGTALAGQGKYAWTKTETLGLGVTSVDAANGMLTFSFDAVAEAATAALYMVNSPVDIDAQPIVYFRLAIYDIGDAAALDINFGLASDSHATDFDSVAQYIAFHLDGNALDLKAQSTDGTTTVAATDTTVNLVDNQFDEFKIDLTSKSAPTLWHRASGATAWTQLLSTTSFSMAAYAGNLTPIVHVEKTADDTTADVRVDLVRLAAQRA